MIQLVFGDAAFEKRTRVDSRRRMPLDIDAIAEKFFVRRPEKIIETHIVKCGRRRETCNVPAKVRLFLVGAYYGCDRIPAHERTDLCFHARIARHVLFEMRWDRIKISGVRAEWNVGAIASRLIDKLLEQIMRALVALH